VSTVLVVRHALAGVREDWNGDDLARPLDERGRRQAAALVPLLADLPVTDVRSSPARRCTETVDPLGAARGVAIRTDDALLEDADPAGALALVRSGTDGLVLCTHGGLLTPLLAALVAEGVPADPTLDGKGATWVLEVTDGRVVDARYLPPPA
jgi:8-oxo-(d)GTP phosphatase